MTKKLGLVGGMGPESTLMYYRELTSGVLARLGTGDYPELTIESINMNKMLGLCAEGKLDELTELLLGALRCLAAAGCDFAALSANTPHLVFDRLAAVSPLPLVSILDVTADAAQQAGYRRLALLGTRFTMDGAFYRTPFISRGIELFAPHEDEKDYIASHIADELELGVVKAETRMRFDAILRRMAREDGAQAVVLGCTELPLLYQAAPPPLPALDTAALHIRALLNEMLA